jgi:hypothetical protein
MLGGRLAVRGAQEGWTLPTEGTMLEKTFGTVTIAGLCGLALFAAARADDPPQANPRCLRLATIDHTESVSDRDILFYLKNRTIYRNALPQACPGLKSGRPFTYRVVTEQLCDTDTITLLEDQPGGLFPTETCGLGKFELTDPTSVEQLKTAAKQRRN